jgi:hypothetical protein
MGTIDGVGAVALPDDVVSVLALDARTQQVEGPAEPDLAETGRCGWAPSKLAGRDAVMSVELRNLHA